LKAGRNGKAFIMQTEVKKKIAIFISDKLDFKTKNVTRDKEGHYIIIKGTIQQEDITTVNMHAPKYGRS